MISESDVIVYPASGKTAALCLTNAKAANFHGGDPIPGINAPQKDLVQHLRYQFVGQITTCAASQWLFQDDNRAYKAVRDEQNKHPYVGDGGVDLFPYNIDVKGSFWRLGRSSPLDFNLFVRAETSHPGTRYIASLADFDVDFNNAKVWLIGWIGEEDVTTQRDTTGRYAGAYVTPYRELNPLPASDETLAYKLSQMGL